MSYVVKQRHPNGVTYSDPDNLDRTVRFKSSSSQKLIGGHAVTNNVVEIILLDKPEVAVGTEQVTDTISVRLKVSGSAVSSAQKTILLDALAYRLALWDTESVFEGFEPTSAPVIPAP